MLFKSFWFEVKRLMFAARLSCCATLPPAAFWLIHLLTVCHLVSSPGLTGQRWQHSVSDYSCNVNCDNFTHPASLHAATPVCHPVSSLLMISHIFNSQPPDLSPSSYFFFLFFSFLLPRDPLPSPAVCPCYTGPTARLYKNGQLPPECPAFTLFFSTISFSLLP